MKEIIQLARLAVIAVLAAFVLMALFIKNSEAGEWRQEDTARQLVLFSTLYMDRCQTQDIGNRPDLYETNRFLGENPSSSEIDIYFIARAAGHTIIAYYLPDDWRPIWQGIFVGMSWAAVDGNDKNGLEQPGYGMEAQFTYTIKF